MSKIYPAIDIIQGKCVRLTKGDYDTVKIYDNDPYEVALQFYEAGAKYMHIVDLDAAKNPENNNRGLISNIIDKINLKVQTGGGIRTESDVENLLAYGADRLIIGSVAVTNRTAVKDWVKKYGHEKIVIGADIHGNKIATHGWLKTSDETIDDFLSEYMQEGATNFLCTDISKDGMLSGSSSDLYQRLITQFPEIGLIASGGVTTLEEIKTLISMRMEGIIIGKAIYEKKIELSHLFTL